MKYTRIFMWIIFCVPGYSQQFDSRGTVFPPPIDSHSVFTNEKAGNSHKITIGSFCFQYESGLADGYDWPEIPINDPVSHLSRLSLSWHNLYNIKKGIIYYRMHTTITGSENVILYFDHFGGRQLIQMSTPPGMNIGPEKLLQIDSVQYTMMDSSKCIKSKRKNLFSIANIDFMRLDSISIQKYGIRKLNRVVFLGRDCNKYLVLAKDRNLKGEIIEWRGVPLSMKFSDKGITQESVAYKLDTISNIPANLFELPKNIEIIDATRVFNQ